MSNCGCVFCKGEAVPENRAGWSRRRNKKGYMFGRTASTTKSKRYRRGQLALISK